MFPTVVPTPRSNFPIAIPSLEGQVPHLCHLSYLSWRLGRMALSPGSHPLLPDMLSVPCPGLSYLVVLYSWPSHLVTKG